MRVSAYYQFYARGWPPFASGSGFYFKAKAPALYKASLGIGDSFRFRVSWDGADAPWQIGALPS
jgi:hypothetical protein